MPLQETSGAASYDAFGGGAAAINYVDDVFSTWLYDGNGSTQTITNGIDLAGKGGLVWSKARSSTDNNVLLDTVRGANSILVSNTTAAASISGSPYVTATTTGYSIGTSNSQINASSTIYTSWTFRKQPKFFDVVTYTGNGSNRTIAHSLGSVPGCIIVKRTDTTSDWQVYHRSNANTEYMVLNSTAAKATGTTRWNSTAPTSTEFSLGTDTTVNASGGTYVAYLFAHDAGGFGASGTDNAISCGSYTGTNAAGNTITLGYEPQYLLIKNASASASWFIYDVMRGLSVGGASSALLADTAGVEGGTSVNVKPSATGFIVDSTSGSLNASGNTYIYIAIRRGPMRTPTTGTSVFTPTVYTGTNVDNRLVNTTIAPDMVWVRQRDSTTVAGMVVGDRLRSQPYLLTGSTAAEVNDANSFDAQLISGTEYGNAFSSMNGFWVGNDATAQLNASTTSNNQIAEAFKRAPGFFDVVCYTGTGGAATKAHNLGVVPEMMIFKPRNDTDGWPVYHVATGNTGHTLLNANSGFLTSTNFNNTTPTASVFSVGNNLNNSLPINYVAYLFASLPGISKVGSYTGNGGTAGTNGTSQTINCGFTAGSRFVLIKRTDSIGNWYVFDSARGIVAASDPYILTNSTAAEVTSVDAVDTDNSGFIVNQTSGTDLNVTSATYIFLAIA
jgi:hypothetical protein